MILQTWLWLFPLLVTGTAAGVYLQRRRVKNRHLYQQHLERALEDGILTDTEARELEGVRAEGALSEAEVRMVALSLYRRALNDAVADARITEQEDATLKRLREELALSDNDLAQDVEQLQRMRVLAGVERGDLPHVDPPTALADGEVCHWVVQGRLAEQLVVPGRRTELRAISFDVDGEAAFSASGERSALAPSSEMLPVDIGLTLVTNRRTLFQGARRHVSIPHMKLRTLDLFLDGVALDESDPSHSSFLLVNDPELSAAILLCAARKRKRELKNLSTRSA